jgi:hypothetical protein
VRALFRVGATAAAALLLLAGRARAGERGRRSVSNRAASASAFAQAETRPPSDGRDQARQQAEPAPPARDGEEPEEPELGPPAETPRPTSEEAPPTAPTPDAAKKEGADRGAQSEGRAPAQSEAQRPGREASEPDEEDLAARALQRSLVQRGALLLPVWGFEIVPGLSYGHVSQDTFTLLQAGDRVVTVGDRRRSHQLTGILTSRLGLPWDLQVEASVPVLRAWTDELLGGQRNDAFGSGLGDPRFSVTRQLVRARKALPDLLITGMWKPQVGSSPFNARPGRTALGTGFPEVGATLTATKASDPLVFLASASYTAALSVNTRQGALDPSDTWGLGAGAILAVSPETSMSFLLDLHYKPEDRLNGKSAPGSDQTVAVLQLGVATVVSPRALLNFTLGIGLTEDSPNLQLGISVPLRF